MDAASASLSGTHRFRQSCGAQSFGHGLSGSECVGRVGFGCELARRRTGGAELDCESLGDIHRRACAPIARNPVEPETRRIRRRRWGELDYSLGMARCMLVCQCDSIRRLSFGGMSHIGVRKQEQAAEPGAPAKAGSPSRRESAEERFARDSRSSNRECGNRITACTDAVGALQNAKHHIQGGAQ